MDSRELDITSLLQEWGNGDCEAGDVLMQKIYPLMREIARSRLRRSRSDITLDATDLANEAYMRLAGMKPHNWQSRAHFLAVSARAIRNIVVDHLRSRNSEKRGGELPFVSMDDLDLDEVGGSIDLGVDWLSVHEALEVLEAFDSASSKVVELKFFSGMTTDEIALATGHSRATVVRQWRFARAWMADRLKSAQIGAN